MKHLFAVELREYLANGICELKMLRSVSFRFEARRSDRAEGQLMAVALCGANFYTFRTS